MDLNTTITTGLGEGLGKSVGGEIMFTCMEVGVQVSLWLGAVIRSNFLWNWHLSQSLQGGWEWTVRRWYQERSDAG